MRTPEHRCRALTQPVRYPKGAVSLQPPLAHRRLSFAMQVCRKSSVKENCLLQNLCIFRHTGNTTIFCGGKAGADTGKGGELPQRFLRKGFRCFSHIASSSRRAWLIWDRFIEVAPFIVVLALLLSAAVLRSTRPDLLIKYCNIAIFVLSL